MPRFERLDGRTRLAWQVDVDGRHLVVRHGPAGRERTAAARLYESPEAAKAAAERLIAEHRKAGFVEAEPGPDGASVVKLSVHFSGAGESVELATMGARFSESRWSAEADEVELKYVTFEDAAGALDELKVRTAQLTRQGLHEDERRLEPAAPPGAPAPELRGRASRQVDEAACLSAAPHDARPWRIHADWLAEQGDVRGWLAALFLEGRIGPGLRLLETEHERLWGPVARHLPDELTGLVFHHGFLTRARLRRSKGGDTDLTALTKALLERPVARFVRELRFGLASDAADNDWGPVVRMLAGSSHAGQLTALDFDDFGPDDADLASTPFGDLSALWSGLPALERLTVRSGAGGTFGSIHHPRLVSFTRVSSGLSASELESIVHADWPALERLALWTGARALGGEVTLDGLSPVLEGRGLPRLTHLGLVSCELSASVVARLLESPLLRRLSTLDLSRGVLGDAEAVELIRHADRFAHLTRFDLSENVFDASLPDLRRALPNALLDRQRPGEGDTVAAAE